jgi:hypothetical protein
MSGKLKYLLIIVFLAVSVQGAHYVFNGAFKGGFRNLVGQASDSSQSSQLSIQAQMDLPIGEGSSVEWESEPLPMAKAKPKDLSRDVTDGGRYVKAGWKDLASLNPNTGRVSNLKFAEALKKPIMVPGFIVPLTDGGDRLSEFLLVPEPMMCIHVPAPPPEYIVTVRMKNSMEYPEDFSPWAPYWIKGRLKISKVKSELAESAYEMIADSIEIFEEGEA